MRIFSFSGLRIVRLRPRRPLPAGANRLVHGRLRRFHPSAQPRACGCPRSASFSGPDAHRMRPGRSPENISGNMSEDMSGNLSGPCPKEPREGAPDGSEKRPERRPGKPADGAPGNPQTALREVLQWRPGKPCRRRSGKSCKRRSGKSCNGVPRAPRSPAPGAPDPPQPSRATAGARFIRLRENIFLLFE